VHVLANLTLPQTLKKEKYKQKNEGEKLRVEEVEKNGESRPSNYFEKVL
jgi:hypothetical protein